MLSCLVMRYFAAIIETKFNPDLKNKPMAIVSTNARPKVIATDELAYKTGVVSNLTIKQAQVLCPTTEIIRCKHDTYQRIAHEIAELLLDYTHKVEVEYQPTTTAWYVETVSLEELQQLQKIIATYLGITPTIGIGSNKFVARVASASNFQDKALQVKTGDEAKFLAQFPVELLPLDKDMKRRLPLLGIKTLGQYAKLPRGSVLEQFGKHGRWLHDLANGKDIRPLQSYIPAPKLHQNYQTDEAITSYEIIKRILEQLSALLVHQLNQQETGHVILTLELENKTTVEHHIQPPEAISTHDALLRHLETLLYRQPLLSAIVGISIFLQELQELTPKQLSMFDTVSNSQSVFEILPKWQKRYQEIDFVQANILDTPACYIPSEQYQLQPAVGI